MGKYKLSEIIKILKSESFLNNDTEIHTLVTDSRTFVSPDGTLFFALSGVRHDGHLFIEDLYKRGLRNFVVNEYSESYKKLTLSNFLVVKDTLKALQQLAAYHRNQFDIPVIGITGSNGKTIIKEWLFQLMQGSKKVVRSPKSYNSQVGVPLSVWLLEEDHEIAIFEAGISQVNEMQNLKKIISPTIGIFSNIGDAHQQNFIDYKHKISEKLKLFSDSEILIYCRDYSIIENQIKGSSYFEDTKLFTWSRKFPADLFITNVEKKRNNSYISGKFNNEIIDIKIPFIDDASIENAIHCWALMLLAYNQDEIKRLMAGLQPVAMRLELKSGINNCTIINDSYNSDLGSLAIAMDFLNQQNQHKIKTLIISDILQSGKNETGLYKEVSDLISAKKISRLIGIGEAISRNQSFFKIPGEYYITTQEFIKSMSKENFRDEAILLKGSRSFEFEEISNILQQKAHRTILEVNLNSMIHNLNYFRSVLNPSTKIMVMVKALSYGSGTYEISNLLQFQNIDYLGVAFADEGVFLRKSGITLPIVVMNPEEQSFESMLEYNLEPEIYSFKILRAFASSVNKMSLTAYPVHIKIETGMNRLGFLQDEIERLISEIKMTPEISLHSVFSHLAASDEPQNDEFTKNQIKLFDATSKQITDSFNHHIIRHILNSSGIERFPDYQYEMVRLGIGLYGFSSTNNSGLINVSTLKSKISQIKKVPANSTVGYNLKGLVNRDSIIAIIPIGYSDGLRRSLSNGIGSMYINDHKVPIIGNICMDMCMLDITDIDAEEGDEVIVFGEKLTINEIALTLNTIPYEIMTGISERVKRVYIYE